jgi:tetratricopeptide (TPR) repeat protein
MADLPIDIQKKIDNLIDEAYEYFQKGNTKESFSNYNKAFDLILEPKNKYGESFNIIKYLLDDYITIKDKDKAYEKIKDLEKYYGLRYDAGELELIKGKTFFEFEDYNEALQYFDIAFKKSKGREFQDEDPKYLDFYKNPDKYIKS